MPRRRNPVPAYLHHKLSGQAYVRLPVPGGRRDVYLGSHGSPESRDAYAEIVKAMATDPAGAIEKIIAASPAKSAPSPSVAEVLLAFMKHATEYYRRHDGTPTSEVSNYRTALKQVRKLYAHLPVTEFGPLALKAVRDEMVRIGWHRKTVNYQVARVRRAFRWAAENEMMPATVWQSLQAVRGLSAGRTAAPDNPPVRPADLRAVAASLKHLPPTVAAMVRFQWLTGCRAQDVCNLRGDEIEAKGESWVFRPGAHKNAWRGKVREVYIGPKCQRVIGPYLERAGEGYLFSPRLSVEDQHAARGEARVTPRYPSHMKRNATKRKKVKKRGPGEKYDTAGYGRAIERACEKAGVPRWTPLQMRHAAGTRFRRLFGIEMSRILLGHSSAVTSEIYAEPDRKKAAEAIRKAG